MIDLDYFESLWAQASEGPWYAVENWSVERQRACLLGEVGSNAVPLENDDGHANREWTISQKPNCSGWLESFPAGILERDARPIAETRAAIEPMIRALRAARCMFDFLQSSDCICCGAEPGCNIDCRLCVSVSEFEAAVE